MVKLNIGRKKPPARTHEGAVAQRVDPLRELRRTVMTCMLWEDTFYDGEASLAERIRALVARTQPKKVAALAVEAREKMQLRHVPLFLVRELARQKGSGALVAETLERVIQRADELAELVAIYWKEEREPLSAGVKRGLARAFTKFDAYALAKYDRQGPVKLRDVLFLCHAKPKDEEQAALWKKLVDGSLESPDTWEVALSSGKSKLETWDRLLREGKLGGLATLRNLRNMLMAGVDEGLIRARLEEGAARALPFRFVTAARHAPRLEDALEKGMLRSLEAMEPLPGSTGLLVDVSGSMDSALARRSQTTRMDAACGLGILLREKASDLVTATFSNECVEVPARRGFALRDAMVGSQPHQGTYLKKALQKLRSNRGWASLDRLIVITDEQSHDGIETAWTKHAYVVNVAPYQYGVSYGGGWTHIDGWSERVFDYVVASEKEDGEAR